MAKQDNITIFQKTKQMYQTEPVLIKSIEDSIARQRVYVSPQQIEIEAGKTPIILSKNRTLEAASHYKGKTAVLNFASAKYPGGGVEGGSNAQEESLCRISTLYPCLCDNDVWEEFYCFHRNQHNPLYSDRLIYTPDIMVFRKDDAYMDVLPKNLWWKVDVITCAAPNKSMMQCEIDLEPVFISRFKAILAVAKVNGVENVVLGAFGCGVYGNDPYVVANAAKEALKEFSFKSVEFAVYCSRWDSVNYDAFSRVFSGSQQLK